MATILFGAFQLDKEMPVSTSTVARINKIEHNNKAEVKSMIECNFP